MNEVTPESRSGNIMGKGKSTGLPLLAAAVFVTFIGLGNFAPAKSDEAQKAYDACINFYNTKRNSLGGAWAFVSGVKKRKTYCFWSWREGDYSEPALISVVKSAMNGCRKAGYSKCFQYGNSGVGLLDWSRQISDQGGMSYATLAKQNRNRANQQALGSFLQGFAGALNSYNSYTKGNGGYGNSNTYKNNGGTTYKKGPTVTPPGGNPCPWMKKTPNGNATC